MTLETQLWLWLEKSEREKPRAGPAVLAGGDQVVSFLQDEDREGREAREAGDGIKGLSSKTQ